MPSPRELPFRAGPYECYHFIGGHRAEVYLARDTRTGFNRAVKVLGCGYGVGQEAIQRFVMEGLAASRCSHPNVVTTYEVNQTDELAYIAMEHLQGEPLKARLERGALKTMTERVDLACQIARGLGYLHSQGVIHGDVKPENISIDPLGGVKVFDFGVMPQQSARLDKQGKPVGTPLYMSPEQVRGDAVTAATDIYSFGVLLFVMFSGSFPYRAVSREDLYAAVVFYAPDLSPLSGKGIPESITEVIAECLQKSSGARPPSFVDIEQRLREPARPVEPEPVLKPATAPPVRRTQEMKQRSHSSWAGWLAGAVVLMAAGGGGWWYHLNLLQQQQQQRQQPEPRKAAKGGFVMLVPGGPAVIGKDRRTVPLASFYIDRTEVTNDAYREFCRSSSHVLPDGEAMEVPASFPVINVNFDDAAAFCAWAGKRLPTDLEWEKAARGAEGRTFPWGEQLRFDLVNIPYGNEPHELQPAESNFSGASPYGAINMLGNVWEWVAKGEMLEEGDLRDVVMNPPAERGERAYQIRGGSYQQKLDLRQAVWDFAVAPARLKRSDIGFRCAK